MKPEETNQETPTPGKYLAGESSDHVSQYDQLQWLAFCYAADELTASQRADFESHLSTDLSAQEALAAVVELSSGVHRNFLNAQTAQGSKVLERAGNRKSVSDQSSTLSRMLLVAASILVLATIGYGVSQSTIQSMAHKNIDEQTVDSDFSADEWINSFDEVAEDQIALAVSEEDAPLVDLSESDDLGLDPMLISFYSDVFDSQGNESLIDSKSPNQNPEADL